MQVGTKPCTQTIDHCCKLGSSPKLNAPMQKMAGQDHSCLPKPHDVNLFGKNSLTRVFSCVKEVAINTKWVMGLPVLARVFAVLLLVLPVFDF